MKFAFLLTSLLSTVVFAAPQRPQARPQSTVQFNTNVPRPAPSVTLIPAIAFGSAGFSKYELPANSRVNINADSAPNYEAGVLAELGRGTFVFQTGLMYINTNMRVGASMTTYQASATATLNGSLSYLAVPLALKSRFRIANGTRLAARLGVMPAALTSSKMTASSTSTVNGVTRTTNEDDDDSVVRKGQVFAFVGVGPEFSLGRNQNLRVEANLEQMLFNLSYSDANIMMRSLNAMLSYGVSF